MKWKIKYITPLNIQVLELIKKKYGIRKITTNGNNL